MRILASISLAAIVGYSCAFAEEAPSSASRIAFNLLLGALQNNDCDSAEKELKQIADDYIVRDLALLEVGKCYEKAEEWKPALKYLEQAYTAIPELSPNKYDARLIYALLLARREKKPPLNELLPTLPDPSRVDEPTDLQRLFVVIKFVTDDFRDVNNPQRPELNPLVRALYLSMLANVRNAPLRDITRGVEPTVIWPEPSFIKDLARSYYASRDFKTSLRLYQSYWQQTNDAAVLPRLANLSKLLNDNDGEEQYSKLQVEKATRPAEARQAAIQLGRFYWNKNRNEPAKAIFAEQCRDKAKAQEAIHACYLWGRVLEAEEKRDEAEKAMATVLRLDAQDEFFVRKKIESLVRIAWLAYENQQFAKARKWYLTALAEDKARLMADEIGFWLGMTALHLQLRSEAKNYFEKTAAEFPYAYFGLLAKKRAEAQKAGNSTLTFIDPVSATPDAATPTMVPYNERENILIRRFDELLATGHQELASREMSGLSLLGRDKSQQLDIAGRLIAAHDVYGALKLAKLAVNYDERQITREWLPYLFPKPYYAPQIDQYATLNGIDPLMVLALIRQESEFKERIVSGADAYGVMQILPKLATTLIASLGGEMKDFRQLFDVETNVRLGIFHLGYLWRRYNYNWSLALAAYNGSEGAVARWRERLRDPNDPFAGVEFIEKITYGETKNYVKVILRNYMLYQAVYRGAMDMGALP